ncbi:MAG: FxsA family protein [Candidatus Zapsychrus exili]|nr:FxsA family protein [Candidatus Zapsychrus exili]
MFGILILLFTVLPALELILLIRVGAQIGAFNTLFIIVFTGVLGAYLARLQGFVVLRKIQENLSKGMIPNEDLLDGLMILVGGIVLLTPGFITDITGFLLLIPLTRSIIKFWLSKQFEGMIKRGNAINVNSFDGRPNETKRFDDIDV